MSLWRMRVPGGTLKVKFYRELNRVELARSVPVWKIGWLYFVWWPSHLRIRRGE